jgi:hypothetical protein
MGEKKKHKIGEAKPGRKPITNEKDRKKIVSITLTIELHDWVKEWAGRRDRSVSWAINHLVGERRNRELAEKHLGQKVVKR